jgi:hypothetical protein
VLQPETAGLKSRCDHVPSGFRSPYASRGLGLQRIQMRPPMADQEQLARPFLARGRGPRVDPLERTR